MSPVTDPQVCLQRLPSVIAIRHRLLPASPASLSLEVTAAVNSAGWTDVQLVRREYVAEPPGGVWEFDLLAKPPQTRTEPIIMPVTASYLWERFDPAKVKGIRVYGSGVGIKEVWLP